VSVLEDLRRRGATKVDLIVTDGHDGLLAAVSTLFAATPRQRCLLHKQRNVLNAVPRRVRPDVETELLGIWAQPTKEGCIGYLVHLFTKLTVCTLAPQAFLENEHYPLS
jgi:putative transposase